MNIKKAMRLSSLVVLVILLGGCSSYPQKSGPVTVTMADGKEITVTAETTYEEIAPYLTRTYTDEEIEKLKMEEPYKSYLTEYQNKLLPQGSVVYIPGADSLEMVVSRNHLLTGKFKYIQSRMPGAEEKADYFVEKYPDGQNEATALKAVNHQDIGLILHVGMESELENFFLADDMNQEGITMDIKSQLLDIKNRQTKDTSQYEFIKERTGEMTVVKKMAEKFLPIGSIVRVGGDDYHQEKILVITARMVYLEYDQEYDMEVESQCVYIGYEYPEGLNENSSSITAFMAMGVEEILYVGMESPEETLCEAYHRTLLDDFTDVNGNY